MIRVGATTRATVEMTTGAIAMMTIRSRWVVVPAQLVHETTTPKMIDGTASMTCGVSNALATRGIEPTDSIHATCSCGTLTFRADVNGRSSTMRAIASTP